MSDNHNNLSEPPNAESIEISYPLEKHPHELQFGDIIELPPDSGRDSGATLALEAWTQDNDTVHANGILFRDKPILGGTESFKLPASLTVIGHDTLDQLVEYYLGDTMMAKLGQTKIEELLREMQSTFKIVQA